MEKHNVVFFIPNISEKTQRARAYVIIAVIAKHWQNNVRKNLGKRNNPVLALIA